MFEKEISAYAFNIAKRYTGERILLGTVLTDVDLPDSFKKFAEADAEEIIDGEEMGKSKTGKFNFSAAEVQALLKEIRHIFKNSFEFSREEFLELADRASKFVFNYVIRPRWTLEKFLFKGEPEVDRISITKAIRFLDDYPYYPKGMIEYLDFQKRDTVDVETWKKIHGKIDEQLLGMLPSSLGTLMEPMSKLFGFSIGSGKVPIDAMILFFRDKSAAEIVDRIEFTKEVKGVQFLDVPSLTTILQASSKDVSQKVEVLQTPEEPPKEFRTFDRQTFTNPLRPPEPIVVNPPDEKVEPPAQTPGVLESEEQIPLDQQLVTESLQRPQPAPQKLSPSIRTYLSAKQEGRIIKKVFDGSKSRYYIAIHKLDECADWKSAAKIVEGIFIDNGIDPFSKYAVAFTDAVNSKFNRDQRD